MTEQEYRDLVDRIEKTEEEVSEADAKEIVMENAEALISYAVANLPSYGVELSYVDYREELSPEQVGKLVDNGSDWFWDQGIWDDTDQQYETLHRLLDDALPGLNQEMVNELVDNDEYDRFKEACWDANKSDPLKDLLRHTGRVMFRINIRNVMRLENLDTGDWVAPSDDGPDLQFGDSSLIPSDEFQEMVDELIEAAVLDPTALVGDPKKRQSTNREQAESILANASYGGNLVYLVYLDAADLLKAVDGVRYAEEKKLLTVTLSNPDLLMYDGFNGSGHDEVVTGNFKLTIDPDKISDVFYVDAPNCGTGYDWSESIAGVVKSYYETDPDYAVEERETTTT